MKAAKIASQIKRFVRFSFSNRLLGFFDREKENVKFFKISCPKPDQRRPRHRNGKSLPIHTTLEVSLERLKLAKQTQFIFHASRFLKTTCFDFAKNEKLKTNPIRPHYDANQTQFNPSQADLLVLAVARRPLAWNAPSSQNG